MYFIQDYFSYIIHLNSTGVLGRGLGLFYLAELVKTNEAECLIASNSGLLIQQGKVFVDQTLEHDIGQNLVLIKISNRSAGL